LCRLRAHLDGERQHVNGPTVLRAAGRHRATLARGRLGFDRARAILQGRTKWVNGTALHYYFFDRDSDGSTVRFADGSTRFVRWVGDKAQQDVVRTAFASWKNLDIGLEFREVDDRCAS
jgi:hypothetical protein